MNLDQIIKLMEDGNMDKCISALNTYCVVKDVEALLNQYDPQKHDVKNKGKRQDKQVKNDEGVMTKLIPVARLPLPYQKKIVMIATAFMGKPINESAPTTPIEENLVKILQKILDSNKIDYKFKNIVKTTKSERQCAELWFPKPADKDFWAGFEIDSKYKQNVMILSHSNGDTLRPVYDEYGDMVAFGRGYKVRNEDDKVIDHFDIYTADKIYQAKKEDGGWLFGMATTGIDDVVGIEYTAGFSSIPNTIGKIPVIYYHQPLVDWADVQDLICALEVILSDHNDTNKYNGNPIVFAEGEVTGFADKGETGKVLEGKNGAKVSYLTWDSAPESIKMEIDNLKEAISYFSGTPDTSLKNLMGLGYFSTVALQTMFMDALLKAADSEEIFGEGLQRRNNYLKAAIAVMDNKYKDALPLEIKPKFEYYLPKNALEQMQTITTATNAGILSKQTAVTLNPLVSDPEEENKRIDAEKQSALDQQQKTFEQQNKTIIPAKPQPAEQN